jgi:hypothetical protein
MQVKGEDFNMSKTTYPLKPCPWCKTTPKFKMYYGVLNKPQETFLPEVYCENVSCKVNPKSKYVAIRKLQRFNPLILKNKIERAIENWNSGNEYQAKEGIQLDFEEIAKEALCKD